MARKIIDPADITDEQLEALRSEAVAAGDSDMVEYVDLALHSEVDHHANFALVECAKAMQAALDADDSEVGS